MQGERGRKTIHSKQLSLCLSSFVLSSLFNQCLGQKAAEILREINEDSKHRISELLHNTAPVAQPPKFPSSSSSTTNSSSTSNDNSSSNNNANVNGSCKEDGWITPPSR